MERESSNENVYLWYLCLYVGGNGEGAATECGEGVPVAGQGLLQSLHQGLC